VVQHRQDREHADPVADEVRRVLGVDHAFTESAGQEGFQPFQHGRVGATAGDQFGQVHVARRVEEMHAAKARANGIRQGVGHRVDAQARGVGRHHRMRCDVRGDLAVQVEFPVHPLGDGLDDQIAFRQQRQMLLIIRGGYRSGTRFGGERRGRKLAEVGDGAIDDAIAIAVFRRQIEQHRVDAGVDQVCRDLRAHYAGAEDGHLADFQVVGHGVLHYCG